MSTSIAVHAPIAASSSSVGVKSASPPVPVVIRPPRSLATVNRPGVTRWMDTARCAESVAMPLTLPDPALARGGTGPDQPGPGPSRCSHRSRPGGASSAARLS